MPTPDGLTTTTIHGKFVEPDLAGTPLSGTLTFTPNPAVVTFPTENVIVAGTQTAVLDQNGEFSIELISTDQGGENPTGWTYSVNVKLNQQKPQSYQIALPYNNGETVELSDITPTDVAPTYIPVIGPPGAPGIVTTVNGYSAATIDLIAADVGAVDLTEVGVASGVASLDATTHVPVAQIPDLSAAYVLDSRIGAVNGVASLDADSKVPVDQIPDISTTYVATSRIGAANGVASLGAGGLIPSTQLDLADAAPGAIATLGTVGVGTQVAREDHTHAGVDLTSAQSVGGAKNFTAGTQTLQLGVGVAPGTSRVHILSAVDESGLQVDQVTLTGSSPLIGVTGFDSSMNALTAKVNGDTVGRVSVKTSGNIEFGSGGAARDTTLYRSSAGNLNSNQFNADAAAPTANGHLTRKDYVDAADALAVHLAGAETIIGVKTFTAQVNVNLNSILVTRTAAADSAYRSQLTGDTNSRLIITADGKSTWGPGNAVGDTNLYRNGVGLLKTDSIFNAQVESSTTAFTVAANFTVTSVELRRTAGITSFYLQLVYTGATATGDPSSNIPDILMGTLGSGWVPPHPVSMSIDVGGSRLASGLIDSSDSTVKFKTLATNSTLDNGQNVVAQATWVN